MSKQSPIVQNDKSPLASPHAVSGERVLASLHTSIHGLTATEIATRLQHYGRNALPRACPSGIATLFLRQSASPLIYVLVAAALLSVIIRE
jgi:magnesium-transporting ATPase (P-type)